jgi:D-cysteine desulfhydrase family pyridoxal phosphate-dependent enzyme
MTKIEAENLQTIPRIPLAVYPTPLLAAPRLAKHLGSSDLYFKRDDLISFGCGGNKIRGLEFILADALAQGAQALVTGAGVQSNHVRATAAAAVCHGLGCHAVYWGQAPENIEGNYRLCKMFGATVHFTGDNDRTSVDTGIIELTQKLQQQGIKAYAIPRGGACALGVLGHVLAVKELFEQCQNRGIKPDLIVLAGGSGGTYAGWLLGIRWFNLPWQVCCFSVSRPANELSAQVAHLANEAAKLLQLDFSFHANDIEVNDSFIGSGYGTPSIEGTSAISLVGRTEGILLDSTYTGKAMAGFINTIPVAKKQQVVFIHTGGEPAFFAGDGQWLN